MAKMTPEQKAAYAMDFGVARSGLPKDAQLAYDRVAEQRARARTSAPVPPAGAEDGRVTMPRWVAAVGTALILLIGQGTAVVLLPYAFTHWQPGTPPWPVVVRAMGVALIAAGGIVVIWGFVRFCYRGRRRTDAGRADFAAADGGRPLPVCAQPLVPGDSRSRHRPGAAAQQAGAADLRGRIPRCPRRCMASTGWQPFGVIACRKWPSIQA
jgi:hypothetical protein